MSVITSYVHGGGLRVEEPVARNVNNGEPLAVTTVTPRGAGAEISLLTPDDAPSALGASNWFHLSLPCIVDSFQALRLRSVFLLFHSGDGEQFTLGEVHLWDGARRLHAFPARNIRGALLEKGQQNTFVLDQPQKISAGLGLSFSLTKGSGLATRPFLLAGAGAEFETWVETALSAPPRLRLLGG